MYLWKRTGKKKGKSKNLLTKSLVLYSLAEFIIYMAHQTIDHSRGGTT